MGTTVDLDTHPPPLMYNCQFIKRISSIKMKHLFLIKTQLFEQRQQSCLLQPPLLFQSQILMTKQPLLNNQEKNHLRRYPYPHHRVCLCYTMTLCRRIIHQSFRLITKLIMIRIPRFHNHTPHHLILQSQHLCNLSQIQLIV